MNIVLFSHPLYFQCRSIHLYTKILAEGMTARGHKVEVWLPRPLFYRFPIFGTIRKWLGYIDQFIVFPKQVRKRLKTAAPDTLFVFTDHALGPWVPLVKSRPHVIHCHDLLAQRSALGEVPENRLSWSGRWYQAFIRRGFSAGKNFISVSEQTRIDLHRFLPHEHIVSEVVYNALTQKFNQTDGLTARSFLTNRYGINCTDGYLLHVGGNQWYKNRVGVIELYNEWRLSAGSNLPLLLIGELPSQGILSKYHTSPFKSDIHLLTNFTDEFLPLAYAGARILIFPSLAEGFGWPIAEAMACGCPVITTDEAPMTEVAGKAGFYISKRPFDGKEVAQWASQSSAIINHVLTFSAEEYEKVVEACLDNAGRFEPEQALQHIEDIYLDILKPAVSSV
jgi:glycosyltransferase involved in cell wall biosynthesis